MKTFCAIPPGTDAEAARFEELKKDLEQQYLEIFPNPRLARTVVVIPSLSMDAEVLAKISGVQYYEERMLCLLLLLRMPRTRVIYVTSMPVSDWIIDYYLNFLTGIPSSHARKRLTMLACHDASPQAVTEKILTRPRLLNRIRSAITDLSTAHMTCFNATEAERTLAVELGIPLYACDPTLNHLGMKSGSREIFKEAGVKVAPGYERLRGASEVASALSELKGNHPDVEKAVVKLEEGVSGEGNATFSFAGCPSGVGLERWVARELPQRIRFVAATETWDRYAAQLQEMGGIVEAFVAGDVKRSPSVQCRIDPIGKVHLVSTHDQVLGGPSGQIFLGSTFPADPEYGLEIQEAGRQISSVLKRQAVLGRFAVDFVSVQTDAGWDHYAIEINLRKGGTTHTYLMLEFLTGGSYQPETGLFRTPSGLNRYYYATDNLTKADYRRLTPGDLIDVTTDHQLHFNAATQTGVMFHLIGAIAEFGKLGVMCVGESVEHAEKIYRETVQVLDREANRW